MKPFFHHLKQYTGLRYYRIGRELETDGTIGRQFHFSVSRCLLCVSVVNFSQLLFTTETRRSHRDTEEERQLRQSVDDFSRFALVADEGVRAPSNGPVAIPTSRDPHPDPHATPLTLTLSQGERE